MKVNKSGKPAFLLLESLLAMAVFCVFMATAGHLFGIVHMKQKAMVIRMHNLEAFIND